VPGLKEAMMRYAVVIEKADGNYSAYVPDLPGCVATAPTVEAIEEEIRAAIRFHIDGLSADGLEVPQPTSLAEYVET
jgi:predicted RNase H-like HicB family nuclease